MEKLSAIAQISILLLIAFLIGIFMAWLYWRRKYKNQRTFEGETKDLEIQRLSGELKRFSTVFEGKSPEAFLKNQEEALLTKESEIERLKSEMGKITYEGKSVSPDTFLEKVQAELRVKEQEATRLKEETDEMKGKLNELQLDGIVLTPSEFLARREAELEAKAAEIFQLSQGTSTPAPAESSSLSLENPKTMEHLGQLRWDLSDKDTEVNALEAQLDEKNRTITSLSAELGQLKFVDMDGVEKTPLDLIAQLRGEIEEKASEIDRLGSEPIFQEPQTDNSMAEQLGEFRWELSEKDEEIKRLQGQLGEKGQALTSLSAELGQLKYVDMDGVEKSPLDLVSQLRGEIESKESELAQMDQKISAEAQEESTKLAESLGELRWELSEKDEQLGVLKGELAEKAKALTSLSAELGHWKFTDMDGVEKSPMDMIAQLRGELEAKEAEIESLNANLEAEAQEQATQMEEQRHALQEQLAEKTKALNSLSAELGQLKYIDMDGVEKSPFDLVAELRGELEAKDAEILQLGTNLKAEAQEQETKLAEQLGELRWAVSEKEDQMGALQKQLGEKSQALTSLSAELGQMKFVDMDGMEKSPFDIIAQLRGELDEKDAEIHQLGTNLKAEAQEQETKLAEQLGELRWAVSEKEEQMGALQKQLGEKSQALTSLSAELGQLKFVDMDGTEKSPFDLVGQMREEIESKDLELAQLRDAQANTLRETENKLTEQIGELRWEASEKASKVEALEAQLADKAQEARGLHAELGQMKFVDMDGVEKSPFDLLASMRGELEAKEEEVAKFHLSQQEAIQERETKIDQLSNNLIEKGARVEELEAQLSQNAQAVEGQLQQIQSEKDQLSKELGEKGARLAEMEAQLAQSAQSLEGQLQQKDQELAEKHAEILQLSGQLSQLQVEGTPVSPEEFRTHMTGALQEKAEEISSLKAQQQAVGLNNGETLSEFMARKNMEFDAQGMELQQLKEKLSQLNWGGIPVSLDEYMAKKEAEVEAKNSEINHLLGELSQLQLDGVQLRPVDFSQRIQEILSEKDQNIQGKSQRIVELEEELQKLKYVANQEKQEEDEEGLEWREREAELVRLSAENEQLRKGYSDRGISIDEAYVDFIPTEIYDLLVEYGDEGISLSNHNGYFLVFNERLQELTGYSKEEANDTSEKIFLEKIYPDPIYRTQVGRQIADIPEDGSFNSIRTQITTKEGIQRGLDVSSTTFYHKGMKYYLSAYVDVAEN